MSEGTKVQLEQAKELRRRIWHGIHATYCFTSSEYKSDIWKFFALSYLCRWNPYHWVLWLSLTTNFLFPRSFSSLCQAKSWAFFLLSKQISAVIHRRKKSFLLKLNTFIPRGKDRVAVWVLLSSKQLLSPVAWGRIVQCGFGLVAAFIYFHLWEYGKRFVLRLSVSECASSSAYIMPPLPDFFTQMLRASNEGFCNSSVTSS